MKTNRQCLTGHQLKKWQTKATTVFVQTVLKHSFRWIDIVIPKLLEGGVFQVTVRGELDPVGLTDDLPGLFTDNDNTNNRKKYIIYLETIYLCRVVSIIRKHHRRKMLILQTNDLVIESLKTLLSCHLFYCLSFTSVA